MSGGSSTAKGNPASKRIMNEKLKAKRKRSWERCQIKKTALKALQREREAKNRELRALGLPTPWELANRKVK